MCFYGIVANDKVKGPDTIAWWLFYTAAIKERWEKLQESSVKVTPEQRLVNMPK